MLIEDTGLINELKDAVNTILNNDVVQSLSEEEKLSLLNYILANIFLANIFLEGKK